MLRIAGLYLLVPVHTWNPSILQRAFPEIIQCPYSLGSDLAARRASTAIRQLPHTAASCSGAPPPPLHDSSAHRPTWGRTRGALTCNAGPPRPGPLGVDELRLGPPRRWPSRLQAEIQEHSVLVSEARLHIADGRHAPARGVGCRLIFVVVQLLQLHDQQAVFWTRAAPTRTGDCSHRRR